MLRHKACQNRER